MEKRTRVCLDCRSVVPSDNKCPGGPKHRVVDLATDGGRTKLIDEVWGPPSWRRERMRLARAGGGGAAAGGIGDLASGCGGCDIPVGGELGEVLGAILIILAVALVAILVVWLIGKLIGYLRRKSNEPRAQGALLPPVRHSERRVRGVVLAANESGTSPINHELCLGWAAELTVTRWLTRHVMLRDGHSFGFDVRLDDGRIARVPAGMIRLARGGQEDRSVNVESYVRAVDPSHLEGEVEAPIPYEEAASIEVRAGDRVEIFGDLHLAPDPEATQTYRGTTAMVLSPNTVPLIRRVS